MRSKLLKPVHVRETLISLAQLPACPSAISQPQHQSLATSALTSKMQAEENAFGRQQEVAQPSVTLLTIIQPG